MTGLQNAIQKRQGLNLPMHCRCACHFRAARLGYVSLGGTLRYLDRFQPLALLVMRLALGWIMVSHGYQNTFKHLHDHVHLVASLGVPAWLGYVSSLAELLGGILVLAGFFTRLAALVLCIDLIAAIWKMHWLTGDYGPEFPVALAALAFALIFFGAGAIAIDHVLRGSGTGAAKRS